MARLSGPPTNTYTDADKDKKTKTNRITSMFKKSDSKNNMRTSDVSPSSPTAAPNTMSPDTANGGIGKLKKGFTKVGVHPSERTSLGSNADDVGEKKEKRLPEAWKARLSLEKQEDERKGVSAPHAVDTNLEAAATGVADVPGKTLGVERLANLEGVVRRSVDEDAGEGEKTAIYIGPEKGEVEEKLLMSNDRPYHTTHASALEPDWANFDSSNVPEHAIHDEELADALHATYTYADSKEFTATASPKLDQAVPLTESAMNYIRSKLSLPPSPTASNRISDDVANTGMEGKEKDSSSAVPLSDSLQQVVPKAKEAANSVAEKLSQMSPLQTTFSDFMSGVKENTPCVSTFENDDGDKVIKIGSYSIFPEKILGIGVRLLYAIYTICLVLAAIQGPKAFVNLVWKCAVMSLLYKMAVEKLGLEVHVPDLWLTLNGELVEVLADVLTHAVLFKDHVCELAENKKKQNRKAEVKSGKEGEQAVRKYDQVIDL